MPRFRSSVPFVLLVIGSFGGPLIAAEPYIEFLKGLQRRGYGEAALAYLDGIANDSRLPKDFRDTLDLERSTCWRIAADEAATPEDRQARRDAAQQALDEFRSTHATHPALAATLIRWGDALLQKGEQAIQADKLVKKEESGKTDHLADARTWLKEARGWFVQAMEQAKPLLELKQHAAAAEETRLEAQFKIALVDYLQAQANRQDESQHTKLLRQSGQEFDAIFQAYRTKRAGILAHLWHGKMVEELGDHDAALDFYDEVLVTAPDADASLDDAAIYGQAELFRLRLLATKRSLKEVVEEGNEWLKLRRKWSTSSAFHGVALEVAKGSLSLLDKGTSTESARLKQQTLALLANVGKGETEYKQEALLLRKELLAKTKGSSGSLSFDEAIATGNAAAAIEDWTAASEQFRKALEIAHAAKQAEAQVELAQRRLSQCRYQLALAAYRSHKLDEAVTLAGDLVMENPHEPIAESAMILALAAATENAAAASSEQKAAAQERIERLAKFAIKTWPQGAPGDEGRVSLMRLRLQAGDRDGALESIEQLPTRSKRYAAAQHLAGQIYWDRYLQARKASDSGAPNAELSDSLEAAQRHLQASVDRQRQEEPLSGAGIPKALAETQLLLVQVLLEAKDFAAAAPLANQLVDDLRQSKPAAVTPVIQQTCIAAVKANLGAQQFGEATAAVAWLAKVSPDQAAGNTVLVDLVKLIQRAWSATSADDDSAAAWRNSFATTVDDLIQRQAHSAANLMFLGDLCTSLSKTEHVRDAFERALKSIESSQGDAKAAASKQTLRVRALLIGLLRQEGKLAEALHQADELTKANPNALEPLLEKGRILQALANREPKRLDECVAHWTQVRVLLGKMKNRPPEYYEAVYQAAFCLVMQSRSANDIQKARQAEQILKSTLTLNPQLDGVESQRKFEHLLTQARSLQPDGKR